MHRYIAVLCAGLLMMVALSACGGSGGTSKSSTSAKSASSNATVGSETSAIVTESKAAISELAKGLDKEPPAGPPAQRGKTVWVISCGQAALGCAGPTSGVVEAGKKLGWTVHIADGKLTPTGFSAAINQAVAAKPDGIITIAIDCSAAKSAYEAAKSAHIITVAVYAVDCNYEDESEKPLITKIVRVGGGPSWPALTAQQGKYRAQYAIAQTDGKAKVIQLNEPDFHTTAAEDAAFKEEIEKCSSCEIVASQDFTGALLADPAKAAQIVSTLLVQNPEANVLQVDSDTLLQIIAQAIRTNHRPGLIVLGGEGFPITFSLIRQGYVSAAFPQPANWFGWAADDTLNRLFAGEAPSKIPDEGANLGFVDKSHNLPAPGSEYMPGVNYKKRYEEVWAGA